MNSYYFSILLLIIGTCVGFLMFVIGYRKGVNENLKNLRELEEQNED